MESERIATWAAVGKTAALIFAVAMIFLLSVLITTARDFRDLTRRFICYQHEGKKCRIVILKDGSILIHEEEK